MPNWTSNIVNIEGSNEELQKLYNRIIDSDGEFNFESLIPMPQELVDSPAPYFEYIREENLTDEEVLVKYPHRYSTIEEVAQARAKSDRLIELYGFDNWYDWCVENWGTKWNAGDTTCVIEGDNLFLSFSTAWNHPVPIYNKLVEEYPNFFYHIETQWEGEEEGQIACYYPTIKSWTLNKTRLVRLHPQTDEPLFFEYDSNKEVYVDQHGTEWDESDYHDMDYDGYQIITEDLAESNI